ncbi:restriction endonuclease subunit S [Halodesulfovibrio marinisediminis]|uniref:Type I restriction enzyme, S subunit n=1 Tax=Halodesulfovibrio marinisediminis DSM 17456 TaxID=1121457 RepID=A0A1N6FD78_9BACT|nr:restriction endonuclease subunit S [Halodesulfovibrio marinisediminis]SIN93207.1 type I restriction enzyme, S subunit [Halodesulfovibrio marinisediminis DSM 17456]
MGKYKPYPEYKSSGVEWLREVPEKWSVKRLKFAVPDVTVGVVVNPSTYFDDNGKIPFLRGVDVERDSICLRKVKYITEESNEYLAKSQLFEGDLVSIRVGYPGVTAVVPSELDGANCASLLVIRKPHELPSRLLCYQINSQVGIEQIRLLQQGAAQEQINVSDVVNYFVVCPPVDEADIITAFLDHETAKIDRLIEKQEKLIELLKEKRQAVISHAVTKGLNPDAPMKDSGVEWLGEVPEHWEVKPLGYLGVCQNGINIGADSFGSGFPFVSYGDVYKNRILPVQVSGLVESTVDDRKRYSVEAGDVFFTRTSESVEEIGFVATCFKSIPDATFAGFLIRFRPDTRELLKEFSAFYFSSQLLRAFFVKEMNLVTRASLSQDLLKRLSVPIPSREEQEGIAGYLEKKDALFSKLLAKAEGAISTLKERRTALISAAVTGKIDVRDWNKD